MSHRKGSGGMGWNGWEGVVWSGVGWSGWKGGMYVNIVGMHVNIVLLVLLWAIFGSLNVEDTKKSILVLRFHCFFKFGRIHVASRRIH